MRTILLGLIVVSAACGGSEPGGFDEPLVPVDPLPATTGSYLGGYRVPVADAPELAAAATYPVDQVDWTIVGDVVTLHYNLPDGLVGGHIGVTLTGRLTAGATTLDLAGDVGVGACVATTTRVTCREEFGDLGPLPISMAVVEQVAAQEYAGAVADRRTVAERFSTDPIGIVDIDLTHPVIEDNPGGGGADDGGGPHP